MLTAPWNDHICRSTPCLLKFRLSFSKVVSFSHWTDLQEILEHPNGYANLEAGKWNLHLIANCKSILICLSSWSQDALLLWACSSHLRDISALSQHLNLSWRPHFLLCNVSAFSWRWILIYQLWLMFNMVDRNIKEIRTACFQSNLLEPNNNQHSLPGNGCWEIVTLLQQ